MTVSFALRVTVAVVVSLIVSSTGSTAAGPRQPHRSSTGGTMNVHPGPIAIAADGSLWFGEDRGIEHMSPSGRFHLFTVPGAAGAYGDNTPGSLVVDARGTVWFTAGQHIGRLDGTGVLRLIPVPVGLGRPIYLTKGPDGTVWCLLAVSISREYAGTIMRISPSGTMHPLFVWPKHGSISGSLDRLDAFAIGEGNRIWFTDTFVTDRTQGSGPTFFGYVDSRKRIVRFPMPRSIPHVCPGRCLPLSMLSGVGGKVWFGLFGPGVGQFTAKRLFS